MEKNKEFFKKLDDYSFIFPFKNSKAALKVFRFYIKHQDSLKDLSLFNESPIYLLYFLNGYFALQDDEEKLLEIIEKVFEKKYNIYSFYKNSSNNFIQGYLYDVIYRLNSRASTKKLVLLCGFAAYVGLEDERFKEALKSKPEIDIESEKLKLKWVDINKVFFDEYGVKAEDYEIKREFTMDLKEEDKEKVEFLLQEGYPQKNIYANLFSIDNIIYLVKNGYDLEYWDFPSVKRYYTKENLDNFISYNLDISEASFLKVYEVEEGIKNMIERLCKKSYR